MAKHRKLFEEVTETAAPAPRAGAIDRAARSHARGALRLWLGLLFALVMVMIAVGGMTRLTDSGLSITEWRPVTGALPPLSAEAWQSEFDKYRQIPEYQLQNKGMSLAEFQFIYWWEWGHRQLGRVIGLVWAVGFLGFLVTRSIPPGWTGRLLLPGVLGGVQGAIGWWMVSSGLTGTALDVASYRLATHLGLAFVILGLLGWLMMRLGRSERDLLQARRARERGLWRFAGLVVGLSFVQILLGALVAGIDAGRNYIDWPLMAGGWLPPGMFELEPLWRNFLENDGTVQFVHRVTGYLLALAVLVLAILGRASPNARTRGAVMLALAVVLAQIVLGVITVMHSAPWPLAIAHQVTAVLLWVVVLRVRFQTGYPIVTSIREGRA